MLVTSTQLSHQDFVETQGRPDSSSAKSLAKRGDETARAAVAAAAAAAASTALQSLLHTPMDRGAADYPQTGLPSPYPSNFGDSRSEASSSVDQASAAQYANNQQDVRSGAYQTTATPTSDYSVYPPSARSSTFPDHLQRTYHPASSHSGSSGGGMAQTPTSPSSVPLQDGRHHQNAQQGVKSDSDVPIDPSIAAASPTYPHSQYSPYPPQQDMSHGYAQSAGGLYTQPRPDWTGYGQQHGPPLTPGHHVFPQTPTSAAPQSRQNQVYSFVPIPGAQQHKRPRRRYEEIERMYKCGWNGCEKAYGTLNHLNAHVTMQSHGTKRTPEEFKEIRKEWKARKKEEEAARKADEERQRAAAMSAQNGDGPDGPGSRPSVQLPPIGYQPGSYPAPPSAGVPQSMDGYNGNHMYPGYGQPASPYAPPNQQQMYNQHNGGQPNH